MNDQEFYKWSDQQAAVARFRQWARILQDPWCFDLPLATNLTLLSDIVNLRESIRWYRTLSDEERMKLSEVTAQFRRLVVLLLTPGKYQRARPTRIVILEEAFEFWLLSDRELEILKLRYGLEDGHPRTRKDIARAFNDSPEHIRQIELEALWELMRLREPLLSVLLGERA